MLNRLQLSWININCVFFDLKFVVILIWLCPWLCNWFMGLVNIHINDCCCYCCWHWLTNFLEFNWPLKRNRNFSFLVQLLLLLKLMFNVLCYFWLGIFCINKWAWKKPRVSLSLLLSQIMNNEWMSLCARNFSKLAECT